MAKSEDPKKMAYRMARYMGCSGVHQNDDGVWMPCKSPEELQKISDRAEPAKKSHHDEDEMKGTRKKRKKRGKDWERIATKLGEKHKFFRENEIPITIGNPGAATNLDSKESKEEEEKDADKRLADNTKQSK